MNLFPPNDQPPRQPSNQQIPHMQIPQQNSSQQQMPLSPMSPQQIPQQMSQQLPPTATPMQMRQLQQNPEFAMRYFNHFNQLIMMQQGKQKKHTQSKKRMNSQNMGQQIQATKQVQMPFLGPMINQATELPRLVQSYLMQLNEDRSDLFFRLFDVPKKPSKDQRAQFFIEQTLPELQMVYSPAPTLIQAILERLRQGDKSPYGDPYIPTVFQRVKGTKPSFYMLYKAKQGIEYIPQPKERKQGYLLMATFIAININGQPIHGKVFYNEKEVVPLTYGEVEECFMLAAGDKLIHQQQRHRIRADVANPPHAFIFLVIQAVMPRPTIDIVSHLCALRKIPFNPASGEVPPCIHPPNCEIDASTLFRNAQLNGVARCPRCDEIIQLSILTFDAKAGGGTQDGAQEEPPEKVHARHILADFINSDFVFAMGDEFAAMDFELPEIDTGGDMGSEINFGSAEDYLKSLDFLL